MKRSLWIALPLLLWFACVSARAQSFGFERILTSEDPVPGKDPGVTFGFCPSSAHALNDRGEVAFAWCFGPGGASDGLFFRDAAGNVTLLAESGDPAPGVTGGLFDGSFDRITLNDLGDLIFTALLQIGPGGITADDNLGIWRHQNGSLEFVAREGTQAPGTAPGELFTGTPEPLAGRRGGLGFAWEARDPGGPLATPDGLWAVDASGVVSLVIREGQQAPGFTFGLNIDVFHGRRVVDGSRFAFGASVPPEPRRRAIWVDDSTGTAQIVASTGSPVPGTGGAVLYDLPVGPQAINFAGQVTFRTELTNSPFGNTALVGPDPSGDLELLALEGETAPDTGGTAFGSLGTAPFVISGRGESAFLAPLQGGGNGLWTNVGGTLHAVALQGDPAPGFASSDFASFFQYSPHGLHLNDRGELLFYGNVGNQLHLFHADAAGQVSLVLRRGQSFEVTPGDTKTLTTIQVQNGEDLHDLPRRSFNTAGQILVRLNFNSSTRSGLWITGRDSTVTELISHAALGDSYSAGEGAPPYFAGTDSSQNRCRRSKVGYATRLRTPGNDRSLSQLALTEPGFEWDFYACSGAETKNVSAGGEDLYGEPPQLDPLNAVDAGRDLVSVSIGGNDAFFSRVLAFCLVHEACHTLEPFEPFTELTFEDLFPLAIAFAKTRTSGIYQEVRDATPNATTLALGYPQVLGGRECGEVIVPFLPDARLTVAEQAFMRDATSQLNVALADAAAEVGIHFAPTATHFAGHGVCGTHGDWIHGLLPLNIYSSFHPTVRGQRELARVANAYLEDKWQTGWSYGFFSTGLPRNPDPMPGPSARDSENGASPTLGVLAVEADPPAPCETPDVYVPGQPVRLTGDGFAVSESLSLRLAVAGVATPFSLGSTNADAGGALDVVVALPAGITTPALATVEALGAGTTGGGHLAIGLIRLETSFTGDGDSDGVPDVCDNCPGLASADLTDSDGDGVGNLCDPCPAEFDDDADNDGLCAGVDPCPTYVENDADSDGLCRGDDNCPLEFNPGQTDSDGDGRGDLCDDASCHVVDVTLRPSNGGQVTGAQSNCGLDSYYETTPLSLEAAPDSAEFFTGWTGDVTSSTNPLVLAVSGPLQITANFCSDPADSDSDFVADLCDNCTLDANGDQADTDSDLAGDACDCAPADAGAFAPPGEVRDLRLLADRQTLTWTTQANTAGAGTLYDVVRGDLGQFPVGSTAENCVAAGTAQTDALDAGIPGSGEGFYYLVRGSNACATGSFGFETGGPERSTTTCP